ncbi:MAG: hypothetical protein ACOC6C_01595 [Verrucomicrobiota bacterium]
MNDLFGIFGQEIALGTRLRITIMEPATPETRGLLNRLHRFLNQRYV